MSLSASDRYTPVLKEYIEAVCGAMGGYENDRVLNEDEIDALTSWWSKEYGINGFPNKEADWMKVYAIQVLPSLDLPAWQKWCQETKFPELLEPKPVSVAPTPVLKEGFIINGLPIGAAPAPKAEKVEPNTPKSSSTSKQDKARAAYKARKLKDKDASAKA